MKKFKKAYRMFCALLTMAPVYIAWVYTQSRKKKLEYEKIYNAEKKADWKYCYKFKDESKIIIYKSRQRFFNYVNKVEYYQKDKLTCQCFLSPMPGNCGIKILTELATFSEHQGKNITVEFRKKLFYILTKHHSTSYILATTISDNIAARVTTRRSGYKKLAMFINNNTDNCIDIIGKKLS